MLERFPVSGTEMLEVFGAELQVDDPDRGRLSQGVLDGVCMRYNQYITEGVPQKEVDAALALALLDNNPRAVHSLLNVFEVKKEREYAEKNPGFRK